MQTHLTSLIKRARIPQTPTALAVTDDGGVREARDTDPEESVMEITTSHDMLPVPADSPLRTSSPVLPHSAVERQQTDSLSLLLPRSVCFSIDFSTSSPLHKGSWGSVSLLGYWVAGALPLPSSPRCLFLNLRVLVLPAEAFGISYVADLPDDDSRE